MSARALSHLVSLVTLLLFTACSGGQSTPSVVSSDAGVDAAAPQAGDDAGTENPTTPKQQCEELIACIADIDPANAGAVVTLYGDASNCWKGSASDAEACGKACEENLKQRPECTAASLDGRYLALCASTLTTGNGAARYDVELAFDPRKGGEATFRPLPAAAENYHSGDALMTQPKLELKLESGQGAGETTTPFDVPGEAFDPSGRAPSAHVTEFAVRRLRIEKGNVCSEIEAKVAQPYPPSLQGACVYLPLAEGAKIPTPTSSAITSCNP